MKADSQIQRDVLEELHWDTRVRETGVGVAVRSGVVTLTGTVDSWTARLAARDAASRIAGVLDVLNEIHVNLPCSEERGDVDLAQAVRSALEWDVLVPHEHVRTTVSNGVVTLQGRVDYWNQYDDAARAVRNLAGVREVKNQIAVEPLLPRASPHAVRHAIESALERHAERAAKQVEVAVTDGKVTLSGEVPSWAERNAVEGAARCTPGVWRVVNHLRIQA